MLSTAFVEQAILMQVFSFESLMFGLAPWTSKY